MVGLRPARTRPDERVGRLLTEARQLQNMTLEEVSAALRIPLRQLRALEEGDLSVFSAEVYARGTFARYSQYLGVYAESVQREFQQVLTGARQQVPLLVPQPRSWLSARLTSRAVLGSGVLLVALIIGAYVGWQVYSFFRLPALEVATPVGGIVEGGTTLAVSGRAAPGAVVTVNGEQILPNAQHEFTTELRLHRGVNVVRVEATNEAAGRARAITRHVLVPRG